MNSFSFLKELQALGNEMKVGFDEVANQVNEVKQELTSAGVDLKSDADGLKSEVKDNFVAVGKELDSVKKEVKQGVDEVVKKVDQPPKGIEVKNENPGD